MRLGIKKGDISVALSSWAPLIERKYNHLPMVEYLIMYKSKGSFGGEVID